MNCRTLSQILTARELEYARLAAEPYSNAEIAVILNTTPRFVNYKMHLLYEKLGIAEGYSKSRILLALRYDRENR